MVHVADYLASRKSIDLDFDNFIAEQPAVIFDEDCVIHFGKHKGKRYLDVYAIEPDYFDWVEKNLNKRDILDKVKAMREYLKTKENDN
jgi:hypothetical protein